MLEAVGHVLGEIRMVSWTVHSDSHETTFAFFSVGKEKPRNQNSKNGELIFFFWQEKFCRPAAEHKRSQTAPSELEDLNKSHQIPCAQGPFW